MKGFDSIATKHVVKCAICGKPFDANVEPFIKVNNKRYAHTECYQNNESKKSQEQKDLEQLENYIKKLFNKRVKVLDKNTYYGEDIELRNDFYLVKKDNDIVDTKVNIFSNDKNISGSIVGKIEIILNGEVLGSRNLYYVKKSVSRDKSFISKLLEFLKFW